MHLQQFTGMQSSKRGIYERGTICLLNVYERGTFSVKNVIEKGNGLDLGADLRVYPPPPLPFRGRFPASRVSVCL